ncbi:hypothetical protein [Metabacillus litoralis]|uniref:hypothetical protein n=1 Tax=Metabacillus litoralis TaxID=152268 RepID=UPI001CFEE44B|nr:hypothetical protein [Metabacillus litoralis]
MRTYILILLVPLLFILTACSGNEEEKQDYSGIIGEENVLGYEYIVIKEKDTYTWEIKYKEERYIIKEDTHNKDTLENFRMAVNESELTLVTLSITLGYFLIVAFTLFILMKKNRKLLKQPGPIIALAAFISLYISSDAYFELTTTFQDVKYYYRMLTS